MMMQKSFRYLSTFSFWLSVLLSLQLSLHCMCELREGFHIGTDRPVYDHVPEYQITQQHHVMRMPAIVSDGTDLPFLVKYQNLANAISPIPMNKLVLSTNVESATTIVFGLRPRGATDDKWIDLGEHVITHTAQVNVTLTEDDKFFILTTLAQSSRFYYKTGVTKMHRRSCLLGDESDAFTYYKYVSMDTKTTVNTPVTRKLYCGHSFEGVGSNTHSTVFSANTYDHNSPSHRYIKTGDALEKTCEGVSFCDIFTVGSKRHDISATSFNITGAFLIPKRPSRSRRNIHISELKKGMEANPGKYHELYNKDNKSCVRLSKLSIHSIIYRLIKMRDSLHFCINTSNKYNLTMQIIEHWISTGVKLCHEDLALILNETCKIFVENNGQDTDLTKFSLKSGGTISVSKTEIRKRYRRNSCGIPVIDSILQLITGDHCADEDKHEQVKFNQMVQDSLKALWNAADETKNMIGKQKLYLHDLHDTVTKNTRLATSNSQLIKLVRQEAFKNMYKLAGTMNKMVEGLHADQRALANEILASETKALARDNMNNAISKLVHIVQRARVGKMMLKEAVFWKTNGTNVYLVHVLIYRGNFGPTLGRSVQCAALAKCIKGVSFIPKGLCIAKGSVIKYSHTFEIVSASVIVLDKAADTPMLYKAGRCTPITRTPYGLKANVPTTLILSDESRVNMLAHSTYLPICGILVKGFEDYGPCRQVGHKRAISYRIYDADLVTIKDEPKLIKLIQTGAKFTISEDADVTKAVTENSHLVTQVEKSLTKSTNRLHKVDKEFEEYVGKYDVQHDIGKSLLKKMADTNKRIADSSVAQNQWLVIGSYIANGLTDIALGLFCLYFYTKNRKLERLLLTTNGAVNLAMRETSANSLLLSTPCEYQIYKAETGSDGWLPLMIQYYQCVNKDGFVTRSGTKYMSRVVPKRKCKFRQVNFVYTVKSTLMKSGGFYGLFDPSYVPCRPYTLLSRCEFGTSGNGTEWTVLREMSNSENPLNYLCPIKATCSSCNHFKKMIQRHYYHCNSEFKNTTTSKDEKPTRIMISTLKPSTHTVDVIRSTILLRTNDENKRKQMTAAREVTRATKQPKIDMVHYKEKSLTQRSKSDSTERNSNRMDARLHPVYRWIKSLNSCKLISYLNTHDINQDKGYSEAGKQRKRRSTNRGDSYKGKNSPTAWTVKPGDETYKVVKNEVKVQGMTSFTIIACVLILYSGFVVLFMGAMWYWGGRTCPIFINENDRTPATLRKLGWDDGYLELADYRVYLRRPHESVMLIKPGMFEEDIEPDDDTMTILFDDNVFKYSAKSKLDPEDLTLVPSRTRTGTKFITKDKLNPRSRSNKLRSKNLAKLLKVGLIFSLMIPAESGLLCEGEWQVKDYLRIGSVITCTGAWIAMLYTTYVLSANNARLASANAMASGAAILMTSGRTVSGVKLFTPPSTQMPVSKNRLRRIIQELDEQDVKKKKTTNKGNDDNSKKNSKFSTPSAKFINLQNVQMALQNMTCSHENILDALLVLFAMVTITFFLTNRAAALNMKHHANPAVMAQRILKGVAMTRFFHETSAATPDTFKVKLQMSTRTPGRIIVMKQGQRSQSHADAEFAVTIALLVILVVVVAHIWYKVRRMFTRMSANIVDGMYKDIEIPTIFSSGSDWDHRGEYVDTLNLRVVGTRRTLSGEEIQTVKVIHIAWIMTEQARANCAHAKYELAYGGDTMYLKAFPCIKEGIKSGAWLPNSQGGCLFQIESPEISVLSNITAAEIFMKAGKIKDVTIPADHDSIAIEARNASKRSSARMKRGVYTITEGLFNP